MSKKIKKSLGKKTSIAILVLALLLAGVAITISYFMYARILDEHYRRLAENLARTAGTQLNADKLDGYLTTLQKDEDYNSMLQSLYDIKENNDIEYLYVIKVTQEYVYYILDADKSETACELGERHDILDAFKPYVNNPGKGIPTTITRGKYGWLCTAYQPVYDSSKAVAAWVGVDISMNEVMLDRLRFLIFLIAGMGMAAVIFTIISLRLIRKHIVTPINKLSAAASKFIMDKNNSSNRKFAGIGDLELKTGDEIEELFYSIKTMEKDIFQYIDNLTSVTAEKERIGAELNVATTIQSSMLPCIFPAFPERKEFDIYASMNPAKEVGGDFYDFFLIDEEHLGIVIADVSGKGVPAALFMVIAKTLIKNQAQFSKSPAEIFTVVNEQLCENNKAGMFVTSFMGILNLVDGRLEFANAGHNFPLIYKNGSRYEWIKSKPGFVLAGMEGMHYKSYEVKLEPGDRLFLYTDGVTEAMNLTDELYGEERLFTLLNSGESREFNLVQLDDYIKADIKVFANGAEQADDITMLLLEYKQNILRGNSTLTQV